MKKVLSFLFTVCLAVSVYAQSADVITEILESPKVTFGQVCYLSAVSQGLVEEDASYDDSINALYELGQIPQKCFDTQEVPMANLAFIFAQAWNVKGGIMYTITHGSPRYAFKQLKRDGIIATNIDPSKIVSGWEALSIFTNCSFVYGKMELSAADVIEEEEEEYVPSFQNDVTENIVETEAVTETVEVAEEDSSESVPEVTESVESDETAVVSEVPVQE